MQKTYTAIVILLFCIQITGIFLILPANFYDNSHHLLYSEFIQSEDFGRLIDDEVLAFNPRINGGTYNLGLPMSPQNNNIYGTNRGSRILPLLVFLHLLQKIFGNYWDKIYFLIAIFLPFILFVISAYYYHSQKMNLNYIVAGVFFAFNPWIINRLNTGFLQLHLAYAFMPIPLYILLNIKKNDSLIKIMILSFINGVSLSIMWLFQPHFLIMLGIALTILLVFKANKLISVKRSLFLYTVGTTIFLIGFNFYNVIPSLLYPPFQYTRLTTFSLGSVRFNGAVSTLFDVLCLVPRPLFDSSYPQIKNSRYLLHLMFYLCLTALALVKKKEFRDMFWFIVTLFVFIFLAKGLNGPLIYISESIYEHIPFMHAFRDPSRFIAAIVLTCSLSFSIHSNFIRQRLLIVFYFAYLVITSLAQINKLPIENWLHKIPYHKYAEMTALPDQGRLLHLPSDTSIYDSGWYNKQAYSALMSPIEAVKPSKSNLAIYGGNHDSLFQHAILFALTSLEAKSPHTKYLFDRLHIGKVVIFENIDKYKQYLQIYKADKKSLTSNNLNLPISKLISQNKPIFILGESYQYASISAKIQSNIPIINLSQYINANNLLMWEPKDKNVILTNKNNAVEEIALSSLGNYSLNLDYETRNYDNPWSTFIPYSKRSIQEGFLLRSGKAISTTIENGTVVISPKKTGEFYLALNTLNSPEYGNVNVSLNGKVIGEINGKEKHEQKGFYWQKFLVVISSNSKISITSKSNKLAVIDDVLLIPRNLFIDRMSGISNKLKNHFILKSLNDDIDTKEYLFTDTEYTSLGTNSFLITKNRQNSSWLSIKYPFDYYWKTDADSLKFISDGYGMSFYSQNPRLLKMVYYVPENLYTSSLIFSKVFFIFSTIIVLYLFFKYFVRTYFGFIFQRTKN